MKRALKAGVIGAFLVAATLLHGGIATQANAAPVTQVDLVPTPSQVKGPYFLPNDPVSKNLDLTPQGVTGNPIDVKGQVLSTDGKLISGATIHVWLASPNGVYDNMDKDGQPVKLTQKQMKLRGAVQTDSNGKYSFKALRPGNYALSGPQGDDYRPAHIHIIIEAQGYKTLVTQLYFQGDPYNLKDLPGDEFFLPELLIHFDPALADGKTLQQGTYNFILKTK
jgi:protocatechuate 3,4-dioxygenase beta subunit